MSIKKFTYNKTSGVKFPFIPNKNSSLVTLDNTFDKVEQNLILYFSTEKGSRIMRPRLGINLRSKLGEILPDQILSDMSARVKEDIESYFPSIKINNIELIQPSQLSFELIINYKVKNQVNQIQENSIKIKIQ